MRDVLTSANFYSRTSDSSVETQKPIICETVDELLTSCFDLMTRCMDSDEEIRDLRERQGDLLATLFYRLTYTIGELRHVNIFILNEIVLDSLFPP